MEHDSTGPEPDRVDKPDQPTTPEPEGDVEARLRELEEEAERLRQQLREKQADPDAPQTEAPKPTELEADARAEEADSPKPPVDAKHAVPAPTTPEAQAEAEGLIRQARVAKMRGQARECMDLLKQAQRVAPNLPAVLEALGDELAMKHMWKEAQALYGRASHLAPSNVGVERKFAAAVLKASVPIEALLMGATSNESLMEQAANAKLAAVWSFFIPGTGQLVLGETAKGIAFLVGWIASCTVALLIPNGLKGLIALFGTSHNEPNMLVLLPLFIAVVIWFSAFYDAKSRARGVEKPKVDRPVPPVNLPYE